MTIDTVEQLDEMRARALCRYGRFDWDKIHPEVHAMYIKYVQVIRAADDDAGLETVPKYPTIGMADAAIDNFGSRAVWAAMLAASPFSKG